MPSCVPKCPKRCLADGLVSSGGDLGGAEEWVIPLRMDFSVADIDVSGHIALLMDIDSVDNFGHGLSMLIRVNGTGSLFLDR